MGLGSPGTQGVEGPEGAGARMRRSPEAKGLGSPGVRGCQTLQHFAVGVNVSVPIGFEAWIKDHQPDV